MGIDYSLIVVMYSWRDAYSIESFNPRKGQGRGLVKDGEESFPESCFIVNADYD